MLIAIPPHSPLVDPEGFVAPSADLIGRVIVEARASVWFRAVLRAESEGITIGEESNVQDACVAHTDPGCPVVVGRRVTVGHGAILHGCTIEDGALIGMGAIVLNGARVGRDALVGSGTLVGEGKIVPPRVLFLGVPGRVVRELTEADLARMHGGIDVYVARGRDYRLRLPRAE